MTRGGKLSGRLGILVDVGLALRCGTGVDLERAQADGRITVDDADAVARFGAFLTDAGPPGPMTPERSARIVAALRKHYPDDPLIAEFDAMRDRDHTSGAH